jgi:hypothetical protein
MLQIMRNVNKILAWPGSAGSSIEDSGFAGGNWRKESF